MNRDFHINLEAVETRATGPRIFTADDVRELLRAQITDTHTLSDYAHEIGICAMRLKDIIDGKKPICEKVLEALNFEVVYKIRTSDNGS